MSMAATADVVGCLRRLRASTIANIIPALLLYQHAFRAARGGDSVTTTGVSGTGGVTAGGARRRACVGVTA